MTRFSFPVDPCLFSPLQMHPHAVLFHSISTFARWLHEHWVPYPEFTKLHHTAVAIVGIHLSYIQPFDFFETAVLDVTGGVRARKHGRLLQLDMTFAHTSVELTKLTLVMRPIIVEDHVSLAGAPGTLSDELLSRLDRDEIDGGGPEKLTSTRLATIESAGAPLAEIERRSMVSRGQCEAADQWSFTELPSFVTPGREMLVRGHGEATPLLRRGMTRPIKTFDAEFRRPLFVLDEARTVTRAHLHGDTLAFVHRIFAAHGNDICVTAVETFF